MCIGLILFAISSKPPRIAIAVSSALFYLYSQGYNHRLYNTVIYGLWTETDFASWLRLSQLMGLRAYGLAIAAVCLVVAHVFFCAEIELSQTTLS